MRPYIDTGIYDYSSLLMRHGRYCSTAAYLAASLGAVVPRLGAALAQELAEGPELLIAHLLPANPGEALDEYQIVGGGNAADLPIGPKTPLLDGGLRSEIDSDAFLGASHMEYPLRNRTRRCEFLLHQPIEMLLAIGLAMGRPHKEEAADTTRPDSPPPGTALFGIRP